MYNLESTLDIPSRDAIDVDMVISNKERVVLVFCFFFVGAKRCLPRFFLLPRLRFLLESFRGGGCRLCGADVVPRACDGP